MTGKTRLRSTLKTALAFAILCLLLYGCAQQDGAPTPAEMPQNADLIGIIITEVHITQDAPNISPAPSLNISPAPAPTVAPLPTPRITDTWYIERTAQMRTWMRAFGQYDSDEAIEVQLARWDIDPDRPMIALTFDDGPVPGITDRILDILAHYDARATFFVKGIHVENGADVIRLAVARGCEIGNHSWDHQILTGMDRESLRREITDTNKAVYAIIGVEMHLLRPPGGSCDGYLYAAAKRWDMAVVRWSQSGNVNLTDPAAIASNVLRQEINGRELRSGDIVLLHDTHDYMIEAVEILLPMLVEQGYQLVTVSELLMLSERGIVYGERYDHQ